METPTFSPDGDGNSVLSPVLGLTPFNICECRSRVQFALLSNFVQPGAVWVFFSRNTYTCVTAECTYKK